ncbi:deoxyribose-phosphate aldolase [Fistulina hepatica ATCC 64428]|nr:deoxyribose-phosphate aldolase [Fistulina hepatica ATCC 64428]
MLSNEEWTSVIEAQVTAVQSDTTELDAALGAISAPDRQFAAAIDHTLLKPDATPAQIDALCDEAIRYKFKSCCVNGANVAQVAKRLLGSSTIACAVIGFPLGACSSRVKAFETATAIEDGAREIDMVLNIGALKARDYALVYADIKAVIDAAQGLPVKVILETVFLSDAEKVAASFLSAEAGAAFVKTCTGFLGGGATAADVALMRRTVAYKPEVKVKASAGIRSFEKCQEMFKAGAHRIGTSSGAAIMEKATVVPGTY